jgi:ribosomal protein S13
MNNRTGIKRSIELNFYDLTLIQSLKRYFSYIGVINKNYSDLINEYTKTDDKDKCRNLSETTIAKLDKIYEETENELMPYLNGFSLDAGERIHKESEVYYDEITKIFSEYSQSNLNQTKQTKLQNDFSRKSKNFISNIYKAVKENCPK